MATKNFMTLENLTTYDGLIKDYIGTEDAKSIKSITRVGNTVNFFKTPDASGTAAYTVDIPDVSGFMSKLASATGGKIVVSVADGEVSESSTAISDLATNAFVGAIPEGATATTVVGYIDETADAVSGEIDALEQSLATVATTGAAADVDYDNTTSGLTSDDVQGAIDELAEASAGGVASKTVYMVATGTTADYAQVYDVYQGATGSSASPVASEKIGTINIPKDKVVESGSVGTVTVADEPYPGAKVGDKYIELVLQNVANPLYIPANSLVDIYTGGTNTEATVTIDGSNVVTVTINEIDGSKLAAGSVAKSKLATAVQNSLDLADSAVQSVTEGATNGTIDVDGTEVAVHGLGTAAYTASAAYDAAGAAATVKSEVIGASGDLATADTINGAKAYADASTAGIATSDIQALFTA